MRKLFFSVFYGLVVLSLVAPALVFTEQLFPYITSKAFYFRICIELALPFYIYLVIVDKALRPKLSNWLNLSVILFFVLNVLSAILGDNVTRSMFGNFERMGGVFYLGHLVTLYFYIQLIGQYNSLYLKRFLQALLVISVFVTLNGVSAWLGGPMLVPDSSLPDRVSSTFGNPIFFASFLIIPLFISAYLAVGEERKGLRITYWSVTALQLLGIYISGTRGAIVGLIAGLFASALFYIFLNTSKKVKKFGLYILGAVLVLLILLFVNYNKLPENSKLYRIVKLQDTNTLARIIQWKVALKGFKDAPVIGVGPENYYVISNKYFDPEIYKYDPSWFDKPHNYLIEVLTTVGLLGFISYVSMIALSLFALWKAYKAQLLDLVQYCILVFGVVAYQVQNLTVFDTVSASVAFYIFLGFCTYVWISSSEDKATKTQVKNNSFVPVTVFCLSLVGMLYVVYIANVIPIQISKRVNFGNAYTQYNPVKASEYFNSALSLPYNFDKSESISKYSDFVSRILGDSSIKSTDEFKIKELERVNILQKQVAENVKNNPLLWMRVGVNEMNLAVVKSTPIENSKESINKAIALAPKRVELLQLYIQYNNFKQDWQDSTKVAEQIYSLNPYSPRLQWQLAISYYLVGRIEDAVKMADEAIANGYKNNQVQQFGWYIQYYSEKQDYKKVVPLLELAVELEPNDLGLYYNLAIAYSKIGDYEHAIALARQIMQSDPSQTSNMQNFIKSLETK